MTAHAPNYDPALPSLADLRQMIEARQDLPILRRRDMASAIRTLAGWFSLPEENVPASAKYMRDKLERVHAITASVSPRRIQNVRSLVLAAMREASLSTKLSPSSICSSSGSSRQGRSAGQLSGHHRADRAAGQRPQPLGRVQRVAVAVTPVVDDVDRAREQAEHAEGRQHQRHPLGVVPRLAEHQPGEHEHVLQPLVGPHQGKQGR